MSKLAAFDLAFNHIVDSNGYADATRNERIRRHYHMAMSRPRRSMDTLTAIDRASKDLAGNNGHPQRLQRLPAKELSNVS